MKFSLVPKIALGLLLAGGPVRADMFFVPISGENTITRYDQNGNGSTFTGAFVPGPYGIALDAEGNVYVTTNNNTIEKFGPNGADLGVFASTGINFGMGLAFDRDGNLYAANFVGGTIEKFSPNGTDLGVFANVIGPTGLAFDAAGNLYVGNLGSRIDRFAPDGTPLGTFATVNLNNPEGLAFDSAGNLYVANNGSDSIEIFFPTGAHLGTITSPNLSGPIGLAFDSEQNLYAVNNVTATIEKFTPDGDDLIFASTGFSPAFIAIQKSPALINISTRLNVLTGENVLDAGFIINASGTKRVLIRGLGPSLSDLGIDGALADPIIELHDSSGTLLMENDNWEKNQQSEIAATGLAPSNNAESALITTLSAGSYTVIERGKLATTGVGLVEVYDLGAGFGPELGNISTRGFVDTGNNVMIAGFITASGTGGSGQVLLRALGPSLGDFGVANPLADPMLELRDGNGAVIATNDNWKSDQQAAIEATGLAPPDDAEAALIATVVPGAYTLIESGVGGTTGVGLVEVYNLH
jgi:sugar lactone lactonase YvrE